MRLRYAYNTNGVQNHRLGDALALIADAGYDGVALTLDVHHLDPTAPRLPARAVVVAAALDARALGSVVETGARFLLDPRAKHEPTLVSPEPSGRARRLAFLRWSIDVAATLGSEAVSFWAGRPRPGVDRESAGSWLRAGLEQVAEHAAARAVTVALEPEPGMLVETVDDYRRAARDLPIRLALDVGHCLVTGDREPEAAVRETAAELGTVSLEDMRRGDHTHLPFGDGDLDLPAVLRALAEIGWPGLCCVELSRDSHRADEMVPAALAALREAEPAATR